MKNELYYKILQKIKREKELSEFYENIRLLDQKYSHVMEFEDVRILRSDAKIERN